MFQSLLFRMRMRKDELVYLCQQLTSFAHAHVLSLELETDETL